MKIKIIEPYDFNPRYDQRSLTPNPGPVVVATLLKQNGHDAEVISEYVSDLDFNALEEAELIGVSITTFNARRGFEIAGQIHKPVVFGGVHASLMPQECLNHGDYVIRGDGKSIVELADLLSNGKVADMDQIPNLVYKKNGRLCCNPLETGAPNIVPDFGLLKDYHKLNLRRLLRIPLLVNASRGCRFDCTFCSIKAVYPDFKKKNTEIIVKDIKSQINNQHFLSRFFPRIIWMTDDNFTSDKKWAKALLKEIARLNTPYKFTIQARVDIADDDELLLLMQKAKIGRIYLGIESLDQKSLESFNKNTSIDHVAGAIKKIRKYGIDVHGLFVFGDDAFHKGDGIRVAEFVKNHKLSGLLIQPLTPYPGTTLFRKLEEENRILHRNWQDYNGKVVFQPKHMSPAQLQKEVYDCYRKAFSTMRVLKFLISGQKGFKLEFLGEAMMRHLEWFKTKNYIKDNFTRRIGRDRIKVKESAAEI